MSESTALGVGIDDVDEPLVRAHFKVLAAVLVLVGRTNNTVDVLLGRQRHGANYSSPAPLTVSTIFRAEESMTSWS